MRRKLCGNCHRMISDAVWSTHVMACTGEHRRPVIIGMNNPHSSDPRFALAPHPARVAGWNLWRMLQDVAGTSRAEYMRTFDRRNLLSERAWDPVAARRQSENLWESLEDHTVLVLGQSVRRVLWLQDAPPLLWRTDRGVRWCLVPHPSGLNRWYNDPLHRLAVGYRLEALLERYRAQATD